MKTPPDFESPEPKAVVGYQSAELRRLLSAMERIEERNRDAHESIFETLTEMKADRGWIRRLAALSGGVIAVLAGIIITVILHGATKLDAIESKVDQHISQGMEFGAGLRRDIDRNTEQIKRIEDQVFIGPKHNKKED